MTNLPDKRLLNTEGLLYYYGDFTISQIGLANKLGLSDRNVRRAIKRLQEYDLFELAKSVRFTDKSVLLTDKSNLYFNSIHSSEVELPSSKAVASADAEGCSSEQLKKISHSSKKKKMEKLFSENEKDGFDTNPEVPDGDYSKLLARTYKKNEKPDSILYGKSAANRCSRSFMNIHEKQNRKEGRKKGIIEAKKNSKIFNTEMDNGKYPSEIENFRYTSFLKYYIKRFADAYKTTDSSIDDMGSLSTRDVDRRANGYDIALSDNSMSYDQAKDYLDFYLDPENWTQAILSGKLAKSVMSGHPTFPYLFRKEIKPLRKFMNDTLNPPEEYVRDYRDQI